MDNFLDFRLKDVSRWQKYLRKILSVDKNIRGLYIGNTRTVPSIIFEKDYIGIIDFINEGDCINLNFIEEHYKFEFDYDIILRHFYPCFHNEKTEVLIKRNLDIKNIKYIASKISKNRNKRISIGYVCYNFLFERCDGDHWNKYMFYSVSPNGEIYEQPVDMKNTSYRDSDFLGKLLYMHGCLVKQDADSKGNIKSIGGL